MLTGTVLKTVAAGAILKDASVYFA